MKKLENKLAQRKSELNFRKLISFSSSYIDFQSNDYLGFSSNENIHKNWLDKNKEFHSNGSTGSRLISGNSIYYDYVENYLAKFYHTEKALIFPSGFMANIAVFSTIPQKDDIVLYDEFSHASIREGLRLSFASSFSFKHNDYNSLEKKLEKFQNKTIFVVIEGLYSMDGDIPNQNTIKELQEKFNFFLIVDEAHSTGILGRNGKGWFENFEGNSIIRIHTFGKSFGIHGAVVVCNELIYNFIINFSKPLIYSTAMSFSELSKIEVVHQFFAENGKSTRDMLTKKIEYFKEKFQIKTNENSPIQLFYSDDFNRIIERLEAEKIALKLIKSPTVPKGTERFRITLHSYNTENEMDKLYKILHYES